MKKLSISLALIVVLIAGGAAWADTVPYTTALDRMVETIYTNIDDLSKAQELVTQEERRAIGNNEELMLHFQAAGEGMALALDELNAVSRIMKDMREEAKQ